MRSLLQKHTINTYTSTTRCQRLTGSTMTLFQITFVSVPIKSSFTAWKEKAVVKNMKDVTTGKFTLQGSGKVYTIDFGVGTGEPSCIPPLIGYNGTFPASTFLASSVWWRVGGECTPRYVQEKCLSECGFYSSIKAAQLVTIPFQQRCCRAKLQ